MGWGSGGASLAAFRRATHAWDRHPSGRRLTQCRARAGPGERGEAIRNVYYSDRQLPPGHDPGADSGEAPKSPNGRQRGSRPLNFSMASDVASQGGGAGPGWDRYLRAR
jgi:hypothetical protein